MGRRESARPSVSVDQEELHRIRVRDDLAHGKNGEHQDHVTPLSRCDRCRTATATHGQACRDRPGGRRDCRWSRSGTVVVRGRRVDLHRQGDGFVGHTKILDWACVLVPRDGLFAAGRTLVVVEGIGTGPALQLFCRRTFPSHFPGPALRVAGQGPRSGEACP